MQVIFERHSPRLMNRFPVFALSIRTELLPLSWAMRPHRQNVCRAIRKLNAGSGKRYQHHLPGKVAGRMSHLLIRGRDAARRGVIIDTEVHATAAAVGRIDE